MTDQISKGKSYTIWILKAIATILVVMVHSGNIFGYGSTAQPDYFLPFYQMAATRVPIFFTVSGYYSSGKRLISNQI